MKNILVIEGNNKTLDNTSKVLKLANYNVLTAGNGYEGIEVAKTEIPDLIICNSLLPDIDGASISNVLSKDSKTRRIPFVLINPDNFPTIDTENGHKEDTNYLLKSFESVTLLDTVKVNLAEKKEHLKPDAEFTGLHCLKQFLKNKKDPSFPDSCPDNCKARKYAKKESIYHEGDKPNSVFLIKKGRVKTVKVGPEGKEFLISLHETGDFLGHLAVFEGKEYPDTAIAIEETVLCIIRGDEFHSQVNQSKELLMKFINIMANDINEKEERLMNLAYNSVRARVASALLTLQKKYQKTSKSSFLTIHVSRDDLAGVIGTSTESLIRTLADFKVENIIETDKGEITILDSNKLERIRKFS